MITPEEILEKLKPIAKLVLNDVPGVDKMELFNKIMSLENQGYRCSDFKLLKRILLWSSSLPELKGELDTLIVKRNHLLELEDLFGVELKVLDKKIKLTKKDYKRTIDKVTELKQQLKYDY